MPGMGKVFPDEDHPTAMVVREATVDDLDALVGLQADYLRFHADLDWHFASDDQPSDLWRDYATQVIASPTSTILVATSEPVVIGYLMLQVVERPPVDAEQRVGRIGDAYVILDHRQQGTLRAMVEVAYAWFRERDILTIEHPVAAANAVGIKAWQGLGYRTIMHHMIIRLPALR